MEWVAISSFRGSFWPREQTCVSYISCTGRQVLYHQHHLESHTPHIPICNTILLYSNQPHKTFFFQFLDMEIILLLFAIPFAWNSLLQGQVLLFASLEIIFFILFFFNFFIYLPPLLLIYKIQYKLHKTRDLWTMVSSATLSCLSDKWIKYAVPYILRWIINMACNLHDFTGEFSPVSFFRV